MNIERILLSQTSCYLISLSEGYLLIDCGSKEDEKKLKKQLEQKGIKEKEIRFLFLTHHHSDHCGLISYLVKENPHLCIIMSKRCAEQLELGHHDAQDKEAYATKRLRLMFGCYEKISSIDSTFEPYFFRKEDKIIEEDEFSLEGLLGEKAMVIFTPGHTGDSCSLLIEDHAFVGDSARNMLNFLGKPYYPILINNELKCRDSFEKLRNRKIKNIYPGHGKKFAIDRLKK